MRGILDTGTAVCILALLTGAVLGTAQTAAGADFTWITSGGLWNVAGNWNPSGPPGVGGTGVVNSALTCIANANLASGPTIQVNAGGVLYCGNGGGATFSGHTIVLNGGKWTLNSGFKGVITSSDTVAMEADSEMRAGINNDDQQWILSGLIRNGLAGGQGKLTLNTSGLAPGNVGRGLLDITGSYSTYSGGTVIFSDTNVNRGPVRVFQPGGFGLGDVLVSTYGYLNIGGTNTTAAGRTITVENTGVVLLGIGGGGATFSCRGHNFLMRTGSVLRSGLAGSVYNVVNSYDNYGLEGTAHFKNGSEGSFHLYGPITNGASAGKMVIWAPQLTGYYLYLRNPGNTFSGGIDVMALGYLSITSDGAQGTGPITLLAVDSYLLLDQASNADWAFTNSLRGAGHITVEDGSGNYRLTAAGSAVDPGTNAAVISSSMIGVLTVDGKFAFAATNGVRSTLTIDIANAGTVAGVDHDQLLINHGDATLAASIATCDLVVRVGPTAMPPGLVLTNILASGADFSTYKFHSVTWIPQWSGHVEYGDGYVALKDINRGATIIIIR